MNTTGLLSRENSFKIKAFALLFMIIMHTYAHAEWWYSCSYPHTVTARKFCLSLNICVAIFAFCSGYAFYYIKEKSLLTSAVKLSKFYISCAVIATFSIGIAFLFCHYTPASPLIVLHNFLPIQGHADIMKHSWYTVFFGYLMLLPPCIALIEKASNRKIQYLLYTLLFVVIINIPTFIPYWGWARIYACVAFFAYLFAKFGILERINNLTSPFSVGLKFIIGVTLCLISLVLYSYLPGISYHALSLMNAAAWTAKAIVCLSVIHTAMCIFGLLLILQCPMPTFLSKTLDAIGKHSMNIWLLSALFASPVTGPLVQPYIYTAFPIYTLSAIVFLCYLASLILTPIQKGIISLIFPKPNR